MIVTTLGSGFALAVRPVSAATVSTSASPVSTGVGGTDGDPIALRRIARTF